MPAGTPQKTKTAQFLDALTAGWRHVSNFQHAASGGLLIIFIASAFLTSLNLVGSGVVMGGAAVWGMLNSVVKKITRLGKKPMVEAKNIQDRLTNILPKIAIALDILERILTKVEKNIENDEWDFTEETTKDLDFLLDQIETFKSELTAKEQVDLETILAAHRTRDKIDRVISTVNGGAAGIMLPVFWLLTVNTVAPFDPTDPSTSLAHKLSFQVGSLALAAITAAWSIIATSRQYALEEAEHKERLVDISKKVERVEDLMTRLTQLQEKQAKLVQQVRAGATLTQTAVPESLQRVFARTEEVEKAVASNQYIGEKKLRTTLFHPATEMDSLLPGESLRSEMGIEV